MCPRKKLVLFPSHCVCSGFVADLEFPCLGQLKHKNVVYQQKQIICNTIIATLITISVRNTEIVTCIFIIIKCSFNQFTVSELLMICYQLRSTFNNTLKTPTSYFHFS
jgi:hypothetical protein